MKKNFGAKAWLYPMPVLIIGSYDEEGRANAMNAAWGGISLEDRISICVDDAHKTTANILKRKAFTVHVADAKNVAACDYVGIVSANDTPDKLAKTGWKTVKSEFVDAPVIEDLPMVLECELVSYDKSDCRMVGRIVNAGIDEASAQTSLLLYPNPTTGSITISQMGDDAKEVLVFNIQGQVVMRQHIGGESLTLDLSPLPAGLYLLKAGSQKAKIIKQ